MIQKLVPPAISHHDPGRKLFGESSPPGRVLKIGSADERKQAVRFSLQRAEVVEELKRLMWDGGDDVAFGNDAGRVMIRPQILSPGDLQVESFVGGAVSDEKPPLDLRPSKGKTSQVGPADEFGKLLHSLDRLSGDEGGPGHARYLLPR